MTMQAEWLGTRNILCIRLDNMGDVLMSTPAIRALKHSAAAPRITMLASRSGALLAPFLSDVDETLVYDPSWVKNESSGHRDDMAMIETLRGRHFDAAVIFTVYTQSALPAALMCHLAGIEQVLAHCRENPYRLISHWVRDSEPQSGIRHEVQRQLDLVGSIGAVCSDTRLSFSLRVSDQRSMRAMLRRRRLNPDRGWIVAHCGATAASRRYSASQFAQAFSLMGDLGRPILLTGTAEEKRLVAEIMAAAVPNAPLVDLAGCLSLGELACLINDADLLISNNTGPAHLAAALQTPVVDLYALTNPQHTPWQVANRVLSFDVPCKYCYRSVCPQGNNACLEGVAPQEIVQAAYELLGLGHSVAHQSVAAA